MFQWRIRKQLESPADFYRQLAELFPLDIQKKQQFVIWAKNFHPKVSIETENPFLTTPLLFFRELVKNIAQCPKMKETQK